MNRFLSLAVLGMFACGGGGTECLDSSVAGESCVPFAAQAGTSLTLRVRPNGCANVCGGTVGYSCSVLVAGQTLVLTITENRCEKTPSRNPFMPAESCTLACQIPDPVACSVPALTVGDYAVEVPGAAPKTLLVRATGETECTPAGL